MNTFRAQIANYFGHGNITSTTAKGYITRNILLLKLGRYHIKIIQNPNILLNKLKPNGFIYTTDVEVNKVKSFSEGKRIIGDLCYLLSLASMSQVRPFSYEYNGESKSYSVSGQSMFFRPLFDIHQAETIISFLEQVWPKYRKIKKSRKLAEVIDMLVVAELPVQPLEVKLAQVFIVLENLKSTYAHSKKIPFVKGFFREVSNPPKANLANEKIIGFEKMLKDMMKEVGMKKSIKRVVTLRNEIIHFGLSRRPYKSLFKHYEHCQDLIREYLLRLLGYKGNYLVYSKASRETAKI